MSFDFMFNSLLVYIYSTIVDRWDKTSRMKAIFSWVFLTENVRYIYEILMNIFYVSLNKKNRWLAVSIQALEEIKSRKLEKNYFVLHVAIFLVISFICLVF